MEMPNQSPAPSGWGCPRCGEANVAESRFCRKCGGENIVLPTLRPFGNQPEISVTSNSGGKKSSVGKIALIIFLVLLLLGGAAVGGYFWYQSKMNKEAREYLTSEKSNFETAIKSINGLSTENKIERIEEKSDIFLKKAEEEKNNAEKSLSDTRAVKEKNEKLKTNKLVSGIDSLFKQFYAHAIEQLVIYAKYTTYEYQIAKIEKDRDDNVTKSEVTYKNDTLGFYKDFVKIHEDYKNQCSNIIPPEGLEDSHKKRVDLFSQYFDLLNNLLTAIESNNEGKIKEAEDDLKSFSDIEFPSKWLEIYQLEKYYFDKLHEKFANLRKEADDAKAQFFSVGMKLNMEVNNLNVNIEGW